MTRKVTYCTDRPSKATSTTLLVRMGMMSMQMWPRAYPIEVIRHDAHTHMDYSLEAPDILPAGACVQYSDDVSLEGHDDEHFTCAEQMTVTREDGEK